MKKSNKRNQAKANPARRSDFLTDFRLRPENQRRRVALCDLPSDFLDFLFLFRQGKKRQIIILKFNSIDKTKDECI